MQHTTETLHLNSLNCITPKFSVRALYKQPYRHFYFHIYFDALCHQLVNEYGRMDGWTSFDGHIYLAACFFHVMSVILLLHVYFGK